MNDISKESHMPSVSDELVDVESEESTAATNDGLKESELEVDNAFATLQQDVAAAQDKYARLAAEFENYKKRSEREQQRSIAFANEKILVALLPVLDHLDSAVNAAKKSLDQAAESDALVSMVDGINLVLKQFTEVMGKFGVAVFSAAGEQFDPNKHEAVAQLESSEVDEGTVLEEYQKGYILNDRLVRAARVVVAKAPVEKKSE